MSIQELSARFKAFWGREDILLALLIVTVSVASYSLGRLSVSPTGDSLETPGVNEASVQTAATPSPEDEEKPSVSSVSEGGYVASKNGTKYHLPWCGSAKQIKEENKIWFATKADAEKAGYTAASNCPGI